MKCFSYGIEVVEEEELKRKDNNTSKVSCMLAVAKEKKLKIFVVLVKSWKNNFL